MLVCLVSSHRIATRVAICTRLCAVYSIEDVTGSSVSRKFPDESRNSPFSLVARSESQCLRMLIHTEGDRKLRHFVVLATSPERLLHSSTISTYIQPSEQFLQMYLPAKRLSLSLPCVLFARDHRSYIVNLFLSSHPCLFILPTCILGHHHILYG